MRCLFMPLIFLCFVGSLIAEEEILPEDPFTSSLVSTQTLLPTTVHSISVLSGEWLYSIPDLSVQGPEPLVLSRTLSSDGSYSKKLAFQWDFNLPASLNIEREGHRVRARYRQGSGITSIHELAHHKKGDSSHRLYLSRTKGLTNCYAGEISARTNLHNTVLNLDDSGKQCAASSGYGHVTYFKREHQSLPLATLGKEEKDDTVYVRYKSDFERKANGNLLLFRKEGLYAFNPEQTVCYSWIKWNPVQEDTLEVTASDGKRATYLFSCYERGKEKLIHKGPQERPEKKRHAEKKRYALNEVHYSHRPREKYTYHRSPPEKLTLHAKRPLLKKIEKGEGRFQAVSYYTRGENSVKGIGKISISREDDERIHRVKKVLSPVGCDGAPITTHRFVYHLFPSFGGQTEVIDVYGQKTLYNYSDRQRLTSVERLDREGHFVSKSCLLFDDHFALFEEEDEPLFEKIQEAPRAPCPPFLPLPNYRASKHHHHHHRHRDGKHDHRPHRPHPPPRRHPHKNDHHANAKKKKRRKPQEKHKEPAPPPAAPAEEKRHERPAENPPAKPPTRKKKTIYISDSNSKFPAWLIKHLESSSKEGLSKREQAGRDWIIKKMKNRLELIQKAREKEQELIQRLLENREAKREERKEEIKEQIKEEKQERKIAANKMYQRLIVPMIEKLKTFFGNDIEDFGPDLTLPPEELIRRMLSPFDPTPPPPKKKGKGNLLCRYSEDAEGRVLSADLFDYDKKGNILCHRLFGNLTGKTRSLPHKSSQEVECYHKFFTYSDDHFNVLRGEQDEEGKGLLYLYEPESNRLAAKFITYQEQIRFREFYTYDENTTRICTIKDDGTSPHPDNLSGCHERHIIEISPRKEAPFGLPEVIVESYLDLATGEKKRLKKMICHYDAQGHLTQREHFDANDHFCYSLHWSYDAHGNCLSETNAIGQTIHRRYDANDNLIEENLPTGTEHNTYDFANRLIAKTTHVKEGGTFQEAYSYDFLGNRLTARDRFGQEIRYTYDSFSRLIQQEDPAVLLEEGAASPVTRTIYDSFDRPICQIDAQGRKTETLYNSRGQPIHRLHPDGREESWEYARNGFCLKWRAPNGTETQTERDFLGRPLQEKIVSAQGELLSTQKWTYEGWRVKSTIDPEGVETVYTYDGAGRLSSERKGKAYKCYQYDALNRLHKTELFFGDADVEKQIHTYTYDFLDRLVFECIEDTSHQRVNQISYQYDEGGNVSCTQEDRQEGPSITRIEYNGEGQPLKITQPSGEKTHFAYDYSYRNALGQMVLRQTKTDALGRNEHELFDALGRLVERVVQDAFGALLSQEKITYDLLGRQVKKEETLVSEGEIKGAIINLFRYHLNGQEEAIIESAGTPEQKITHFTYNSFAQKVQTLKPDGCSLFYNYDPLQRVQSLTSSDQSLSYRYAYNRRHQLTQVEDCKAQTVQTCRYDENGQLIEERFNHGLSTGYRYDRMGRLTALSLPDQSTVEYKYDAFHLRQVDRSSKGTLLYTHRYSAYDPSSLLLQERLIGLSGEVNYTYDSAGRPKEIGHSSFTQTIPPHGFDAVGRLREVHTQDTLGFCVAAFNYDTLDHLQEEKGKWNHCYQTDSCHNRSRKNGTAYHTNARHQLLSQGEATYRYDPNGNLIEKRDKEETTAYAYDALDRLIAVRKGEETITYTYDASHRRLSKRTKDKEEFYLYVGSDEIGSMCQGEIQDLRILGHSSAGEKGAIAIELRGKAYAPLYDCQGDLVALIDSSTGRTEESYCYSAFGEEKIYNQDGKEVSHSLNPWRFACKRKDEETGWIYFGRRFYDPETGRWTTPDPLLFIDGPNPYAYLRHRPLMAYDRYGLVGEAYDEAMDFAMNADRYFGFTYEHVTWNEFENGAPAAEAGMNAWDMVVNCYHAFGGILHGAIDFVCAPIYGLNEFERVAENQGIQDGFAQQQQNLDQWMTSTLHVDPDNATYQYFHQNTPNAMQVASVFAPILRCLRGASYVATITRLGVRIFTSESRNAGKAIGKEIGYVAKGGVTEVAKKAGRNRFVPDANATGAHTVFRKDPLSGKVTHYESYMPQTNLRNPNSWESIKRYDGPGGDKHWNKVLKKDIFSPHVHDPVFPGGVRPAESWEIPY